MSFSMKFKALAVLVALSVPMAAAATSKSGKVRSVIGEVTMQKKGEGEWKQLRVGNKVNQPDHIRTLVESNTQIALPDGSTLSIEENSMVVFSQLVNEDGKQTALAEVIQGKVRFNAQKQNDGSSFKFKTGTATAAIRGTDGIVAVAGGNRFVFGLNTGKMDISADNCPDASIQGGELAILDLESCFTKLTISSAGDPSVINQLIAILAATSSLEGLQEQFSALSNVIQKFGETESASAGCTIEALPETIDTNAIAIKGGCQKELTLTINNEPVSGNSKQFQYSSDWSPSAYGTKRFDLRCTESVDIKELATSLGLPVEALPESASKMNVSFACGTYETKYEPKKEAPKDTAKVIELTIAANNDEICNTGALTVKGQVTGGPALTFTVGKSTSSLKLLPEQTSFENTISINDRNGAWNGKELSVTATFADGHSSTKILPLEINKSCSKVNTIAPIVSIGSINKCSANYTVSNMDDDSGVLSIMKDNSLQKEVIITKNSVGNFKLTPGIHSYEISAKDQAGNHKSDSRKMACYPPSNSYLTIDGKKVGSTVKQVLHAPPPPTKKGNTYKYLHRNMRLIVQNVPDRDPSQIKSIQVTDAANTRLLILQDSQIDRLDYDVPLDLEYGVSTTINITVEMYNGNILKTSKTYEVN